MKGLRQDAAWNENPLKTGSTFWQLVMTEKPCVLILPNLGTLHCLDVEILGVYLQRPTQQLREECYSEQGNGMEEHPPPNNCRPGSPKEGCLLKKHGGIIVRSGVGE